MVASARRSIPRYAAWAAAAAERLIDSDALTLIAEATERATLLRLMHVFVADTERRLARLDALAGARDLDLLAREAHALKGSAASMGAAAIADAATELELRTRHGGRDWQGAIAALHQIAERSYPDLIGWCERPA